jgi:hypothetical protein
MLLMDLMLLAADETATKTDYFSPITNLITGGGFGTIVWYMLTKHVPKIEERHQTERKDTLAAFKEERKEWQTERGELLAYIQRRDEHQDKMASDFTNVMIRVESALLHDKRTLEECQRQQNKA